jgi:hypothetical protein
MAAVSVDITGVGYLIANLAKLDRGTRKECRKAITEIGDSKLPVMKERCPFKTGALRDTGRFTVQVGKQRITLKFHFGNDSIRYALKQHEDLELEHKNGQAKYVESVVREMNFARELGARFDLSAAARG